MSCNGCRVLRKGCSEDCTLRGSLQWIKSPESQANATLFLAKFYGRAGLINLINAGPAKLRPEIFRSLLYEACGRIINPVDGSVGLMSSGNWRRCQAAVEDVLRGSSILTAQLSGGLNPISAAHGCDIRHFAKNSPACSQRIRTRNLFKRSGDHAKRQIDSFDLDHVLLNLSESKFTITGWDCGEDYKNFDEGLRERAWSHDSLSAETVELALANRDSPPAQRVKPESCEMDLDLTLRLMNSTYMPTVIEVFDGQT